MRTQGGKKAAAGPTFQNEFFEIAQQLEALKVKLEAGRETPEESSSSGKPEVNALGYSCDENGCVLLDTDASLSSGESEDPSPFLEEMLNGSSWSLGLLSEADGQGYCAVVGGSGWSVSLTAQELKDFVMALKALRAAVRRMLEAGGSEPTRVKWDTKTVKLEAFGETLQCVDKFRVNFLVGGLRMVRGSWAPEVVAEVLVALDAAVPYFAVEEAESPPVAPPAAVAAGSRRA